MRRQSRTRRRCASSGRSSSAAAGLELALEVERPGAEAAPLPLLARQHPEDLELEAVGIRGVEAEAVAVIGGAAQRTGAREGLARRDQIVERRHLPGGVIEPDLGAAPARGAPVADAEQAEVVMVVAAVRAEEDRLRMRRLNDLEAEHIAVEGKRALRVAHVENDVIEASDREHGIAPWW